MKSAFLKHVWVKTVWTVDIIEFELFDEFVQTVPSRADIISEHNKTVAHSPTQSKHQFSYQDEWLYRDIDTAHFCLLSMLVVACYLGKMSTTQQQK